MSEERISKLEKDIAVTKATIDPLIDQIRENTKANAETQKAVVGLTHEISAQVKLFGEIKETTEDHEDRIKTLELTNATEQSGREMMQWIKRAIVTGAVSAFFIGLGFMLNLYFTTKGG